MSWLDRAASVFARLLSPMVKRPADRGEDIYPEDSETRDN